ncbi:MAG: hypothetical protein MUO82_07575 [Candidatus Thermoplasmatota archaeon]|nr:hypothetical protein [Candidatus Thermoplasmatota archaeon]
MGWFRAIYTTREVGWKILLKLILLTAISLIIGESLEISKMDWYYRIGLGIIIVLGLSGFWFFMHIRMKQ